MRDVVKTNVKREQNSKRVRRRKKHKSLYIFIVFILVLGIGILLSVTLFFNINKISVKGDVDYSDENVIQVSGIKKGDNLVRLDANAAEQRILSSMIYIEDADIEKKYPDVIEINLTKCVPSANVKYDDGYILISKKGKILESAKEMNSDNFTIIGLEPASFKEGDYIKSLDDQKTKIYLEIIDALSKIEDNEAVSVDITDKYSIIINYDNRINFELGNGNDIAYKIKLADTVLKDLDSDKKGKMIMVGANQISFISDSGVTGNSLKEGVNKKIPINQDDLPEGYTQPIEENTESEIYDEQSDESSDYSYEDEEYVEDQESHESNDENVNDDYYAE